MVFRRNNFAAHFLSKSRLLNRDLYCPAWRIVCFKMLHLSGNSSKSNIRSAVVFVLSRTLDA